MARLTNDMQLSRGIDRLLPGGCHANVAPFIWLAHIVNCQHTTPHSYSNWILGADRPSIIPNSLCRRAPPPTVQPNNSRRKWCMYWTLEIDWAQRNYRYTLRSFIKLQDDSYRISDLQTHTAVILLLCTFIHTCVHVYYMHITATLKTLCTPEKQLRKINFFWVQMSSEQILCKHIINSQYNRELVTPNP